MFITVCIEFKLDTSSRRPSHISVSVLAVAADWVRAGAAGTRVAGEWEGAGVVLVYLPGLVSFWSQFVYPRLVARARESLQKAVQKFLQV